MIDYDPHEWRTHLLDIKGSMVREIFARVAMCVAWSALVVAIDLHVVNIGIGAMVHAVLGTAIGLLLVFRTNSSYDRFWEGRRMWGNIINESRNLGRAVSVYLHDAPDLQERAVAWAIAYPYAVMHRLRCECRLDGMDRYVPKEECAVLLYATHPPLEVSRRISSVLREARDRGVIGDYVLGMIDQNTQLLIDYMGACERIQKTPLPFAYVVHLRRGLILYCYSLPFALANDFGWIAVPLTLLVAYVFFGIEEIGVEIEGPFGYDENDLPLERFCEVIEADLRSCLERPKADATSSAAMVEAALNATPSAAENPRQSAV